MSEIERHIVHVTWIDAHAEDGWISREDLSDSGDCIVESVGFWLPPTKGGKQGHVSLALTWSEDDMIHSVFHIPQDMVKSVKLLESYHELADTTVLSASSSATWPARNRRTAKDRKLGGTKDRA